MKSTRVRLGINAAAGRCVFRRIYTLMAIFLFAFSARANVLYVSTKGDDVNYSGTQDLPWATFAKAISEAKDGDEIRVAGGVYNEAVASSVVRLKITGSWKEDFSAQDLRNNRTVIKAPNKTSAACFTANAVSNELWGVDLTGGYYGFKNANSAWTNREKNHHKLVQCVLSNNVYGAHDGSAKYGLATLSCLFVTNTYGTWGGTDAGAYHYHYNCTFVDNGTAIYRQHNYGQFRGIRNCAFLRNGYAVYATENSTCEMALYKCAYWQNTQNFTYTRSWKNAVDDLCFGYVHPYCPVRIADPKLAADWQPLAGSSCAGTGEDLSADSVEPVTEDLYGTAWGDTYDIGCVKSGLTDTTVKLADVYVSPDGDDTASGDKDHPLASPATAAFRLAENGILHIANGTYVGCVSIGAKGATVAGESRDGVILRPTTSDLSDTRPDFALGIFASDVTVSNLTLTAAAAGLLSIGPPNGANNLKVCNVSLTGNRQGLVSQYGVGRASSYMTTLSRLSVRDNIGHGLYCVSRIRLDNSLIADNGQDGFCAVGWDNGVPGDTYVGAEKLVVNSTIIGNGTYGYRQVNSTHTHQYLVNTIVAGNGYGVMMGYRGRIRSCAFYDNAGGNVIANNGTATPDERCIYDDPLVDATATLRGHLLDNSPCSQTGTNVNSALPYAITNDLDGVKRIVDKMDMGCYDSPETIASLAGDGYHIVNVAATPNGYGEPNPTYGRHLTPDGSTTLDVACTLENDPIDGRRRQLISEGVRARYVGYDLIRDDDQEVLKTSETDESCTFTLATNVTFRIKWIVEDLITLSSGKPGCKVSVYGCTPAESVQMWVTNGAPVSVTIIPSDDWAHSSWTGDVPTSVDPKESTITWVSDVPRTMSPTLRGVHYVCLTGSDEADGTKAHPWRTINHAIADATTKDWDEVKVQSGLYEECVTNLLAYGGVGHLTLTGSWNVDWQRDLKNARTVVTPPAAFKYKLPCFHTDTGTNTVLGFDFTGGSAGVKSASNYGANESTENHHELVYLIVTNNTKGIDFYDSKMGAALVASLVADNTASGFERRQNRGGRDYVYNCTFVRNGTALTRNYAYTPSLEVINCVFAGNLTNVYSLVSDSSYTETYTYSCFGEARDVQYHGATIAADGWRRASFNSGMLTASPLLDAHFAPTADSPFNGRGQNLVANSIYGFGTDVYGTLWDGVWDMGCIKGGFEAATYDEQYVSAEGDDAQDGLTAATARRSIGAGVAHLNENGTVRVGPGVYSPTVITFEGVKIIGAGPGKSIVTQGGVGSVNSRQLAGFEIVATNVVVEGFTVTNSFAGGHTAAYDYSKFATFRNCELAKNFYGVAASGGANWTSAKDHYISVDRCRITDNADAGLRLVEPAYATSTLVARNKRDGIRIASGDWYSWSQFVHCTVINNGRYGVYNADSWVGGVKFWNSVIAGHSIGAYRYDSLWSGGIELNYTILHNEQNYCRLYADSGRVYANAGTVETDPMIITNGLHYGHLRPRSNCLGAGSTSPALKPAYDLAGRPLTYKKAEKVDCGCYRRDPTPLTIMVR